MIDESKVRPQSVDLSPFSPLMEVRRSGRLELQIFGIMVVDSGTDPRGDEKSFSLGDADFAIWSRSVLKPWQLLEHMQILKEAYPDLTDEMFALFMASHSAEDVHLELIDKILQITGVDESHLQCPQALPQHHNRAAEKNLDRARRFHNCSGKHLGYLAAMKALGEDDSHYLDRTNAHQIALVDLMSRLTHRPRQTFEATIDGCQLPNLALSVREIARLYRTLVMPDAYDSDSDSDANARLLAPLMYTYPRIISGLYRTDYKIMTDEILGKRYAKTCNYKVIAKEGADGILAGAATPCERYPQGLSFCIKLSAGFDKKFMELLYRQIMLDAGLIVEKDQDQDQELRVPSHIVNVFCH